MSKTLTEIAQLLITPRKIRKTAPEKTRDTDETSAVPKVQLIYAFNGSGKTCLSREFKQLIAPKANGRGGDDQASQPKLPRKKILYYNAFTADLFYWDNDLEEDAEPKLKVQPNAYTNWLLTLLKDLGQDGNIIHYFQRYANDKLTPHSSTDFTEVTFSMEHGNDNRSGHIKLSKDEENNFIWSVFYTLLDQVVIILNAAEPEERETRAFDRLEYVFIDDPVSSFDENLLIERAGNLANQMKSSQSNLKFIITTHSTLFSNVLFNKLNGKACYMLERFEDGTFALTEKQGDSNMSFSYHLHLKHTIEQAMTDNKVERFHFTLLRNLYEKTVSFLGYPKWSELLPDDKQLYLNRIINFTSHSTLSHEAVAEPTPAEKATAKLLLEHLKSDYGFWQQEQQNG